MNLIKKNNSIKVLNEFRKKIYKDYNYNDNIEHLLKWRIKLKKKYKIKSKLINLKDCKDWSFDKNNNLGHKSGQFFQVKAVKILNEPVLFLRKKAPPLSASPPSVILPVILTIGSDG